MTVRKAPVCYVLVAPMIIGILVYDGAESLCALDALDRWLH
jgi:hypothetical protein